MNSKEITKKIIAFIEDAEFSIDYSSTEDRVLVQHYFGCVMLEFIVIYNKEVKDYLSATYENQEEFTMNFNPLAVSEISIYINSDLQEVDDNDYQFIFENLQLKIVG